MSRNSVESFIDAIYAIAVTLLALELPGDIEDVHEVGQFAGALLQFGVTFGILFAFWFQHRRINALVPEYKRRGLWLNAVVLFLVCLVPRATALVFEHGGNVTVVQLEKALLGRADWTTAELVDLFYVAAVVAADAGLLLLMHSNAARSREVDPRVVADVRQSKTALSLLLVTVVGLSLALPVENRLVLALVPISLLLEREILWLYRAVRGRGAAS